MAAPIRVPTLEPEEWDFRGVLDADLPIAIWWEYLRAIPEITEAVRIYKRLMKSLSAATDGELFAMSIAGRIPVPFWREEEWPVRPFLLLSHEKRRELRAVRDEHHAAYELEYDLDELEHSIRSEVSNLFEKARQVDCADRDQWIHDQIFTREWIPHRIWSDEPPIDLKTAFFRIDWAKSDLQLLEMFKNWLDLRRPPGVKAVETRGAASAAKRRRALLNQLGAYRLLQCMSWKKAVEHTEARLQKKPLFSEYQHVWRKAAKEAQTQIDSLLWRLTVKDWSPVVDSYFIGRELGGVV
jgi:hypothetical protein